MKKTLRNYLCGFFTALLLIALVVPSFAETTTRQITAVYSGIKVYVNGTKADLRDANGITIQPFVVNGTTYLPIRAIAEAVGYDVSYDAATLTVNLTSNTDITTTPTPTPTTSTNTLDTSYQSKLIARVNVCLNVGYVAYNNLQAQINDYASRGMSRSSGAQTAIATQDSIKSDILVMQGMIVCIQKATTNDELAKIESDFLYYESEYGM